MSREQYDDEHGAERFDECDELAEQFGTPPTRRRHAVPHRQDARIRGRSTGVPPAERKAPKAKDAQKQTRPRSNAARRRHAAARIYKRLDTTFQVLGIDSLSARSSQITASPETPKVMCTSSRDADSGSESETSSTVSSSTTASGSGRTSRSSMRRSWSRESNASPSLLTSELERSSNGSNRLWQRIDAERNRMQFMHCLDLTVISEGTSLPIPGVVQDSVEEADDTLGELESVKPMELYTRAELLQAMEKIDRCQRVAQKVERELADNMPAVGSGGSHSSMLQESDHVAFVLGGKLQDMFDELTKKLTLIAKSMDRCMAGLSNKPRREEVSQGLLCSGKLGSLCKELITAKSNKLCTEGYGPFKLIPNVNEEIRLGDAMLSLLDRAAKISCNYQLSVLRENHLKLSSIRSAHEVAEMANALKNVWDRLRNVTVCFCKCFERRAHLKPKCFMARQCYARVLVSGARAAVDMQEFCQARQVPVQQDANNCWRQSPADPDTGFGSENDVQAQGWVLPCITELIKLAKEHSLYLLTQCALKEGATAEAAEDLCDVRHAFFRLILVNVRRMCWLSSHPQTLPRWGLELLEKQISSLLKTVRSYDKPSSTLSFDIEYTQTAEGDQKYSELMDSCQQLLNNMLVVQTKIQLKRALYDDEVPCLARHPCSRLPSRRPMGTSDGDPWSTGSPASGAETTCTGECGSSHEYNNRATGSDVGSSAPTPEAGQEPPEPATPSPTEPTPAHKAGKYISPYERLAVQQGMMQGGPMPPVKAPPWPSSDVTESETDQESELQQAPVPKEPVLRELPEVVRPNKQGLHRKKTNTPRPIQHMMPGKEVCPPVSAPARGPGSLTYKQMVEKNDARAGWHQGGGHCRPIVSKDFPELRHHHRRPPDQSPSGHRHSSGHTGERCGRPSGGGHRQRGLIVGRHGGHGRGRAGMDRLPATSCSMSRPNRGSEQNGQVGRVLDAAPVTKTFDRVSRDQLILRKELGAGSSGQVWEADYFGSSVAIKVRHDAWNSDVRTEAHNEAQVHKQLSNHPNIVQYYGMVPDFVENSGAVGPGLVMELASLGNLMKLISNARNVQLIGLENLKADHCRSAGVLLYKDWRRRLRLAQGVASGLEYLHAHRIIHRDLTSYNIVVSIDWVAKVCDFEKSRNVPMGQQVACSQAFPNSPRWMAPEILRCEKYDTSADVFSLGVVLWELMTLERPWEEQLSSVCRHVDYEVLRLVSNNERLAIPPKGNPDLPEWGELADLVRDTWKEETAERPTMTQVRERLHEILVKINARMAQA
ncbi:unnamed protein product [Ostreobium quekettii]|uniref:Protein kinase domain-containing protein n=1 Tax=Ostreobium quekettii TaxID=121088 RepID=A0A8S1J4D6_9CHLO|nr:unnamed protein product [Ostreobium quekettii]|eukprot:evm.model.scf_40.2 EVM.evm.TU.scf_40.2   scf_40:10978-19174(+)